MSFDEELHQAFEAAKNPTPEKHDEEESVFISKIFETTQPIALWLKSLENKEWRVFNYTITHVGYSHLELFVIAHLIHV